MNEVDIYIENYSGKTKVYLIELRLFIKSIIPEATEVISYGIPTFKYFNNLVHFAGYEHHIGFYPGADAMNHFAEEFRSFKSAKGSVQFPLNKVLPFELIERVVQHRIYQNNIKLLCNPKFTQCEHGHVHIRKEKCPICVNVVQEKDHVFSTLSNPAQRALTANGIISLEDICKLSKKELLKMHGLGPASMPKILEILKNRSLELKPE